MPTYPTFTAARAWLPALLALLMGQAVAPAVHAEKADRAKPMEIQADRSGTADLQAQITRFTGNVVITQGTLLIKADRVEVKVTPDGYHQGTAWGTGTAPVFYRQKRDGVDEHVEGVAERVEFDGKTEVLRFIGSGVVRRLAGTQTLDEITGSLIVWNHAAEQFSVQGGTPSASSPSGRVRAVLSPRPGTAAASEAAAARTPARAASEPR